MKQTLLDTGPLVAYLDETDGRHGACVSVLEAHSGQVATTLAVLTEAMHLLSGVPQAPTLILDFLDAFGVEICSMDERDDLRGCVELMEKYADTPMDFADATLVALAERLDTRDVFTLDRRGFFTYRQHGRRHFAVLP
jgi:predicted nucleic acid-binding protein